MAAVIHRGNTTTLAFTFKDENGDTAVVASATCQLAYPGRDRMETETLTLTNASNVWSTTWDSSKSRGGWVDFHAHGVTVGDASYTEDGRFKLKSNSANLQHDELPQGTSSFKDYGDC